MAVVSMEQIQINRGEFVNSEDRTVNTSNVTASYIYSAVGCDCTQTHSPAHTLEHHTQLSAHYESNIKHVYIKILCCCHRTLLFFTKKFYFILNKNAEFRVIVQSNGGIAG